MAELKPCGKMYNPREKKVDPKHQISLIDLEGSDEMHDFG